MIRPCGLDEHASGAGVALAERAVAATLVAAPAAALAALAGRAAPSVIGDRFARLVVAAVLALRDTAGAASVTPRRVAETIVDWCDVAGIDADEDDVRGEVEALARDHAVSVDRVAVLADNVRRAAAARARADVERLAAEWRAYVDSLPDA